MQQRGLIIGLLALVILGSMAYLTRKDRPAAPSSGSPDELSLGDFDVNAVAAIRLRHTDGATELEAGSNGWVLKSLHGYPADFTRVADFLIELSRLSIAMDMPDGGQYLDEYGLAPDSESRTDITLADKDGNNLLAISTGNERAGNFEAGSRSGGRYLLLEGNKVVLADGLSRSVPSAPLEWMNTRLTDVRENDIQRVTVTPADGTGYTLNRDGSTVSWPDLSADSELTDDVNRPFRALQYLNFADVADPAAAKEELGFETPDTYVAKDTRGLEYRVQLGGEADSNHRYIRLEVVYDDPGAPVMPVLDEQADEETRRLAQEAHNQAMTEYTTRSQSAGQAVEEAARRLKGWTFTIPSYNAENFILPVESLSKPKPAPAPAEPEADESSQEVSPL